MIVFLLARQRSGTVALGSILDSHKDIYYLGEIFDSSNFGEKYNFFTFYNKLLQQDSSLFLPEKKLEIFLNFLEFIEHEINKKYIVLDIKYRSMHHLNGCWHGFCEIPELIRIAKRKMMPIIHLKRSNYLATFVSGSLADLNQIWHTTDKEEITNKSLTIDVKQLCRYLVETDKEVEIINNWIKGYSPKIDIDYAELFNDSSGDLNQHIAEQIQDLLKVGVFNSLSPSFVKQSAKELSESIENFELVRLSLSGTKFEWMTENSIK